jgi:replicative DNA helicase
MASNGRQAPPNDGPPPGHPAAVMGTPQQPEPDRPLPNNNDAEKSVLGACLLSSEGAAHAAELLQPNRFYDPGHKIIFATILELFEDGIRVEQLAVWNRICENGDEFRVPNGIALLADLAGGVATAANIRHHASILRTLWLKRRAIEVGADLQKRGYDVSEDADETIAKADEALIGLANETSEGGFTSMEVIYEDLFESIDENRKRGTTLAGHNTGYPTINEATGGFENSDLWLIAARPSEGKTALLMQIARFMSDLNDEPGAIISLEMSKRQLAVRQVAEYCSIDSLRVKTGKMTQDELLRMTKATPYLTSLKLHIDDEPGMSITQARARCRRLKQRFGLGFVIVDYLQLMTATGERSREQEVSKVSRGLKGLAKELNIPVLAAAQIGRGAEERANRRPQLRDLRESGSLEQDADGVIFIYHPSKGGATEDENGVQVTERDVDLIIAKQRNGETGNLRMKWKKETTSFRDLKWVMQEQPPPHHRYYWQGGID